MEEAQDPAKKPQRAASSSWSWRIATIAGIPVRIHFTFVLFLAWILIIGQSVGDKGFLFLVPAIFVCVVLHEFGHALVAKKFGVNTRDITLYPIGGVAMLEGKPTPSQEFWISLAGPAVNVAIALIIAPFLFFSEGGLPHILTTLDKQTFLQGLFIANVILPLFNLIPAFPMDGGRVLRSILAMNMEETRATQIAAGVGQALAILLGFLGLMTGQVILMLVAFFVFLGAGQELAATVGRSLVAGHRITDAMQTRFRTINSGESLERAAQMLLEGSQQDFPVVVGDEVVGILTKSDIVNGLAQEGGSAYVAGFMTREIRVAPPETPLDKALELFSQQDSSPILVMEGERLMGFVTTENLSEFIMLQHAKTRGRHHSH